jgi:ribosome-associated heat shock protein Hsp15
VRRGILAHVDSVRIDRWLCAARIFKSRTLAQRACDAGHVCVGERPVRSNHAVRVGDEIRAQAPRGLVVLQVLALADKRQSPPKARELYEDHSPPPPPREERVGLRARGAGRPTKADRRAIERLRGGD